jgi:putative ABC transport system permease protein
MRPGAAPGPGPGAAALLPLFPLVLREWRHHPWRHAMAALAVALGVALAWSVHLINVSALAEFSAAVRSANGEPDAVLRGPREGFDDALLDAVAALPGVALASPVVEVDTYAMAGGAAGRAASEGVSPGEERAPTAPSPEAAATSASASAPGALPAARLPVRLIGLDALVAATLTPGALPRPAEGQGRLAALDPGLVFVNAAARDRLGLRDGQVLRLQAGPRWHTLKVGGSVAAGGTPLVVVDIAAAQALFGLEGRLTRIDLRLEPGVPTASLESRWPPGLTSVAADEAEQRVSHLSRAYRVNLTVLALVALFVGAFLVYSVVSLSVAQRTPALALLGVLGLTAGERRALVLAECGLLGLGGSALGLALGSAMAAGALRWLAGDLGGGYFPGIAPPLRVDGWGLAGFGLLGVASALVGGWVPAQRAQQLQPALALKGLGSPHARPPRAAPALAVVASGVLLALMPPIGGLPVAAYASVAALLLGGVALVPVAVHALLRLMPAPSGALALLALQRARFQRHTATAAVAGVVASLALSVALTVMVTSFRQGVATWLDSVLPADLYARTAASEQAWLDAGFVAQVQALPGVRRVEASRTRALQLAPGRPAVALVARELDDPAAALPLLQAPLPPREGTVGVFVSEAMVSLYGAEPGSLLLLPLEGRVVSTQVRGVWRDYARQFGAVVMSRQDYQALTGDTRLNDLALWLDAPAGAGQTQQAQQVQEGLRRLAPDPAMLEFAATPELRSLSMAIFDRSFAVTYYLQAVAIGIGLIGVAASLSAQVLARRKEFGLLSHLGLTGRQVVAVVSVEVLAWLAAGAVVGLLLGLAISVVLVHVVNPQSFHWTMDLVLPWARLALLCAAVVAAGVLTAAWTARRAASRSAVLSVREDW